MTMIGHRMRTPDRFEFTTNASHQKEAMIAGGKALMAGTRKLPAMVLTNIIVVLAGLGGATLATLICGWLNVDVGLWIIVGWLLGGGAYLLSFQYLYSQMSKISAMRPLHAGPQAITFDQVGMTYEGGAARWVTPWAIIDGVVATRNTISVIVAGVAFAFPKSSVGDNATVDRLIADIKEQIAHA